MKFKTFQKIDNSLNNRLIKVFAPAVGSPAVGSPNVDFFDLANSKNVTKNSKLKTASTKSITSAKN